jgi:hypothetical protein
MKPIYILYLDKFTVVEKRDCMVSGAADRWQSHQIDAKKNHGRRLKQKNKFMRATVQKKEVNQGVFFSMQTLRPLVRGMHFKPV